MTSKTTNKFSAEVRARAVRMVLDHEGEHPSRWAAAMSIAEKIGCSTHTLMDWVKKADIEAGRTPGVLSEVADRVKALEREVRELRQAKRDPSQGAGLFCGGGARPPTEAMIAFIDDHRDAHGVEPICRVLPIAPSTYHDYAGRRGDPERLPSSARRDDVLRAQIRRVWDENFRVYGVRKIWRQLCREGIEAARCTTARLMKQMGLAGVVRGKPVKTTISNPAVPCPRDKVNRQFHASGPNALWVSDFTYVATWQGFVYVAFVIDVFARRIVGWRVSRSAQTAFVVLDALEQALHERRPLRRHELIHHSDCGCQYVSIRYTERLAEAGIEPSVGSVGDSYDNALAETINGLFKAEVIHRRGPWRHATLEWVDWFNHRRILAPIGNVPPAEAEARYYAKREATPIAA